MAIARVRIMNIRVIPFLQAVYASHRSSAAEYLLRNASQVVVEEPHALRQPRRQHLVKFSACAHSPATSELPLAPSPGAASSAAESRHCRPFFGKARSPDRCFRLVQAAGQGKEWPGSKALEDCWARAPARD